MAWMPSIWDMKKAIKEDPRFTKFSTSDKKCEKELGRGEGPCDMGQGPTGSCSRRPPGSSPTRASR